MPNNVTANRNYQLPDGANYLDDDVLRLIAALNAIDVDVKYVVDGLATKSAAGHAHAISDVTGLATSLSLKANVSHSHAMTDLDDANTSGATSGQFLRYVGTKWVPTTFDASLIASGVVDMARLAAHLTTASLSTSYAPLTHTHAQYALQTDMTTALNLKANASVLPNYLARSGGTMTGVVDFADQELRGPRVTDMSVTQNWLGYTNGAVTIDYRAGGYVGMQPQSATQLTITNAPPTGSMGALLIEIWNGGAFTITWPTRTWWSGGYPPTLTPGGLDLVILITRDAGANWWGSCIEDMR